MEINWKKNKTNSVIQNFGTVVILRANKDHSITLLSPGYRDWYFLQSDRQHFLSIRYCQSMGALPRSITITLTLLQPFAPLSLSAALDLKKEEYLAEIQKGRETEKRHFLQTERH